ncbi:hypothetical protein P2G88_17615 [Aliiglaciecola sp. CAU 1673]|uniref:hypothetical protein n=1 Tax=Aliiglaciecola sp. CAU 1673 TaxID=3032595 RepID=UPI0023DB3CB3|nr:hypothetical protein [Aliiglaciecola sp. CAU 1673]MDF2180077.1 hypothetical protein [Aliiglaciecola sp. CAU 1673]
MKSLSPYQQAILTEIGISQWQLRTPTKETTPRELAEEPVAVKATPVEKPAQAIWINQQEPMWQDIYLAVGEPDGFKWQQADVVAFCDGILSAPSPEALQASPALKRQLWQSLWQQLC